MPRLLTLLMMLAVFAVGAVPANAMACDTHLVYQLKIQCTNAMDVNDYSGTVAYCQSAAEQIGICADENQGNARALDLTLKMMFLDSVAGGYYHLNIDDKALLFTDSASRVANEILSMRAIKSDYKVQAKSQLAQSKRLHDVLGD
jgi:hypothetical protein